MLHLPADRLAALVDEPPTTDEQRHLDCCADCSRERDAYRALHEMAVAGRHRIESPVSSWNAIASELRAQGLATMPAGRASESGDSAQVRSIAMGARPRTQWLQAAGAALLLLGGVAAGRFSARGDLGALARAAVDTSAMVATLASLSGGDPVVMPFRDRADALAALVAAERTYEQAASFLVQYDSSVRVPARDEPAVYQARLAALDGAMAATRQALYQAPSDPIINRYYLATVGAREATLRQLSAALPASQQVNRF